MARFMRECDRCVRRFGFCYIVFTRPRFYRSEGTAFEIGIPSWLIAGLALK